MPAKALEPKQLYIAKTWEDLKRRADDHKAITPSTPNNVQQYAHHRPVTIMKLLCLVSSIIKNSLTTLYEEAKKAQMIGDEERAYILYYRFFSTFKLLRESKLYEKDRTYYDNLIGLTKAKEVIEKLNDLTESLTKRYSALKESQELRAKEIEESNEKPTNGSNDVPVKNLVLNVKQNQICDNSYPVIDCQTLYESFENSTEMTRILIFDTRSADEYNDSHIAKLKSTSDITVANTPQDLLTPGLTATKVESIIPLGSIKDAFYRRRQMSKIIIVDRCSQEMMESSAPFILAEALWKVCLNQFINYSN